MASNRKGAPSAQGRRRARSADKAAATTDPRPLLWAGDGAYVGLRATPASRATFAELAFRHPGVAVPADVREAVPARS
ncbi:MAG: hypothetical protein ACLGIV_06135 [Actinomycetes bacterium]